MRYYSSAMNLTTNFTLSEFVSKCGRRTPAAALTNLRILSANLQVLRDHLGRRIRINSGYRSPEHNKAIGGASESQHVLGMAADITVDGMTPNQVYAAIEKLIAEGKMREGGVGLYATWVHYDIRGNKARWTK